MDARQKRGLSGSPNATVSLQSDNNGPRGYGGNGGKSDDTADDSTKRCLESLCGPDGELPEKLRNLEPRLIEHVSNEIMDKDPNRKSEGEHESSSRLKTQFLIEMEGFDSGSGQILLIGATNRPQELDEAARRRLTKRLYIPLPSSAVTDNEEARAWIIQNLLKKDGLFKLGKEDVDTICKLTEGYSGSDMKNLVKDASMGPLREALTQGIEITKHCKRFGHPFP
ncbi:hypothetical protein CsatB_021267 [Cannabis sativa]